MNRQSTLTHLESLLVSTKAQQRGSRISEGLQMFGVDLKGLVEGEQCLLASPKPRQYRAFVTPGQCNLGVDLAAASRTET